MHVVHDAEWFIHSAIKTIRKNNKNICNVKLQVHANTTWTQAEPAS